jgi:hypothetical protein
MIVALLPKRFTVFPIWRRPFDCFMGGDEISVFIGALLFIPSARSISGTKLFERDKSV